MKRHLSTIMQDVSYDISVNISEFLNSKFVYYCITILVAIAVGVAIHAGA